MKASVAIAASLTALSVVLTTPAIALKYAEPEHQLKVDPAIPSWQPGEVKSEP
jgi:phosphate transport system substrate-binding protein